MGFDDVAAKAWRSTNYALLKVVEIAGFLNKVTETSTLLCEALPSDGLTFAAKASCVLTVVVVKVISDKVFFVAKLVRLNIHYQLRFWLPILDASYTLTTTALYAHN